MVHVMKDSILVRFFAIPLGLFLALPNLALVFGDASILSKIVSVLIGSVALWIALSMFFITGVYLREDVAVFHAWFHRYTIQRDQIVEFSAGTQYFDRVRLRVNKVDGAEYEFKVPISAFKLRRISTTVEVLEHWRKTGTGPPRPDGDSPPRPDGDSPPRPDGETHP